MSNYNGIEKDAHDLNAKTLSLMSSVLDKHTKAILDEIHSQITERDTRIAALEAHLNQLQNGHSIPFPAITDRMMIEKAKADAKRITALVEENEKLREWMCHYGGLLNEWPKDWNPSSGITLTAFMRKRLDIALRAAGIGE